MLEIYQENEEMYKHHRSGWKYCLDLLKINKIISNKNKKIIFLSFLEFYFSANKNSLKKNWIGFFHCCGEYSDAQIDCWKNNIFLKKTCFKELLKLKNFSNSLDKCKGIFTFSKFSKDYIKNKLPHIEAVNLMHPTDLDVKKFKIENYEQKNIISMGHWMRNLQSFFDINIKLKKILLCHNNSINNYKINVNKSVEIIKNRINNKDYDDILTSNIVFLDFFDVAASNSILECIARNTPVITRRLPANEEYLGENYPLFFDDIKEVEQLCKKENIEKAHKYLKNMNKEIFSAESFVKNFNKSKIINKFKML